MDTKVETNPQNIYTIAITATMEEMVEVRAAISDRFYKIDAASVLQKRNGQTDIAEERESMALEFFRARKAIDFATGFDHDGL